MTKVKTDESPQLLFVKELEEALAKERLRLSDEARMYLSDLLAKVRIDEAPDVQSSLADRLATALRTADLDSQQRSLMLQSVGNSALLLCGWWWPFFERTRATGIDEKYCEDVATIAYRQLTESWFQEIADNFVGLVDVLVRMSGKLSVHGNKEIMAMYSYWLRTHNEQAEKILLSQGLILPADPSKEH